MIELIIYFAKKLSDSFDYRYSLKLIQLISFKLQNCALLN